MHVVEVDKTGMVVLKEVKPPRPGVDEVLIDVELVGICGTDIHLVEGEYPPVRYPSRPGHEVTGVVAEAGQGTTLTRGQRVCIDPGISCRRCRGCRSGRYNLCAHREALGISLPGGAAEQMTVPASNCYPISADVPPEHAVLCEPLACAIHAVDRVPGSPTGAHAIVYGAGTVGLLAAQVLAHVGARRVDVVEPNEARHETAQRFASGHVVTSAEELDREHWDLVVDASGAVAAVQDGLGRVATGGTYVQLGVAADGATVTLQPYDLFAREITIVGSMTTAFSFSRAVDYLEDVIIDVDGFTGQPWPLDEYEEAIRAARSGRDIKTVVRPEMLTRTHGEGA